MSLFLSLFFKGLLGMLIFKSKIVSGSSPSSATEPPARQHGGLFFTSGLATWDAVKRSEMCVIWNPQARDYAECLRMFYEASDGMTEDQRGVWRIASANCISWS